MCYTLAVLPLRLRFGVLGLLAMTFSSLMAGNAHAQFRQSSKEAIVEQCLSSFGQGQVAERRAKLKTARQHFAQCIDAECPSTVRNECGLLYQDVVRRIPSIVLACRDVSASLLKRGSIKIDGEVVKSDGKALEVDPGEHVFELAGTRPETFRRTVLEGQRTQAIQFACTDPPAPRPVALIATLAGVGVLGLAGFGVFGLDGRSRQDDLETCKGNCDGGAVDDTFYRYLAADISLGVGVVALGVASVLWFTTAPKESKTSLRLDGLHF